MHRGWTINYPLVTTGNGSDLNDNYGQNRNASDVSKLHCSVSKLHGGCRIVEGQTRTFFGLEKTGVYLVAYFTSQNLH
jgi:hypothetical protein